MKRRLSLCLAALLAAGPAWAQSDADRATARQLGREAGAALKANDHARAFDLYSRAERLYKAPTLSLGRARALAGMGKLVSAFEAYRRIVHEGPGEDPTGAFGKAVASAAAEAAALEPRLGGLVLTLQGPSSAQITVDGEPFPDAALGVRRPVDPGQHVVKAEAEGYAPAEASFAVAEGASANVALRLERRAAEAPAIGAVPAPPPADGPAPAPASPGGRGAAAPVNASLRAGGGADPGADASRSRAKAYGIGLLSLGGAGLVIGGVTGLLAMGKHSDLEDACDDGVCRRSERDTLDQYRALGTVSTVSVVGGLLGAAAGAVLLSTSATKKAGAAAVWVGPGGAGIAGRF